MTNAELRDIIENSLTYQNLPEASRPVFMERLLALSEDEKEEIGVILMNEKTEEGKIDHEAAVQLQQLAETYVPELKGLTQKFENSLREEVETEERSGEEGEMEGLIDELDDKST